MMNTRQDNNIFPNHSSSSAKVHSDDQYHDLFLQNSCCTAGMLLSGKKIKQKIQNLYTLRN